VPNPDGCERFVPNPFKKERCKECRRPWTEHKGAIDEALSASFIEAKRKAADDKLKAEASAKEKARMKATAKKKAQQAVEDEWLFDGAKDEKTLAEADSDDDLGFRMFTASDMDFESQRQRGVEPTVSKKEVKVVNLIDFGECQAEEDDLPVPETTSATSVVSLGGGSASESTASATAVPAPGAALAGAESAPPQAASEGAEVEGLRSEIEYMRQMLANAKEETNIQVAIIQDEVVEKQQKIDELVKEAAAFKAEKDRELARKNEEVEVLRKALTEASSGTPTVLPPEMVPRSAEATALVAELRAYCVSLRKASGDDSLIPSADEASQGELDFVLRGIRDDVKAAAAACERCAAERRRLASKIVELEQANTSAGNVTQSHEGGSDENVEPVLSTVCTHSTRALREIRQNAEDHLAWIRKHIKMHQLPPAPVGGLHGMPEKDPIGGGC